MNRVMGRAEGIFGGSRSLMWRGGIFSVGAYLGAAAYLGMMVSQIATFEGTLTRHSDRKSEEML